MKSWKLGLTAAVMALAPASVALAPVPAAAQSCAIVGPAGLSTFGASIDLGTVVVFGDLKIRSNSFGTRILGEPWEGYYAPWVNLDIKAPGFDTRGFVLHRNSPKVFNLCGQEVTFVFDGLTLKISLF